MKCLTWINVLFFVGLVINTDDVQAFFCDNGTEIADSLYCNRRIDCIDESDEGYGCTKFYCGKGKFTCRTGGACLDIKTRCDGIVGCQDQSDDQECGDKLRPVQSQNCTFNQGKFLCENKLACLNFSNVCDGKCNCLDCSDEDEQKCAIDSESCSACNKYCLPTTTGPMCLCDLKNNRTNPLCEDTGRCSESSRCAHYCFRFQTREYCSCYKDYHPIPNSNGLRCRRNDWYSSVILFSTSTKIKYLNLTTNRTSTIAKGVHCSALAAARNQVYYATKPLQQLQQDRKNYIFKAQMNLDSAEGEKLIEWDSPITSIAVDYITNNVYFTANESLFVCTNSNSSQHCTLLRCCGLSNVTLAPTSGLMFYIKKKSFSDQRVEETYYIMKANMDGSDETFFADDAFETPNIPLVVDESAKTVLFIKYLANTARLEFMPFNEESKQIRLASHWGAVSSLTVLDQELFFSKNDDEKIYYAENFTDADSTVVVYYRDNSSRTFKHLYAHNPRLPYSKDNPCGADPCDGLCLLRPISATNSALTYTCSSQNISSLAEPSKAGEPMESKSHKSFGSFFILLTVVAVLGLGGYFAFQKRHLYDYYETMRVWKLSKRHPPKQMVEEVE